MEPPKQIRVLVIDDDESIANGLGAHSHFPGYVVASERWQLAMFFRMFHLPAL